MMSEHNTTLKTTSQAGHTHTVGLILGVFAVLLGLVFLTLRDALQPAVVWVADTLIWPNDPETWRYVKLYDLMQPTGYGLAAFGAGLVAASIALPSQVSTVAAFLTDVGRAFRQIFIVEDEHSRRQVDTTSVLLVALTVVVPVLAYLLQGQNWYIAEDGVSEWLTFFSYVVSSGLMAYSVYRLWPEKRWWAMVVLAGVGILSFVFAGEEISWGQRYLGYETPEALADENVQFEFNLHNLEIFLQNDKIEFSLLFFSMIAVVVFISGLLAMLDTYTGRFPSGLKIILPPPAVIFPMVVVFVYAVFSGPLYRQLLPDTPSMLQETHELLTALVILIYSITVFRRLRLREYS